MNPIVVLVLAVVALATIFGAGALVLDRLVPKHKARHGRRTRAA